MTATLGMANAFDPATLSALPEADSALMERRQRLLGPAYRLFYEHPVHIVRGAGVWLYDAEGHAYLDVYNNVPVVGHCHSTVVETLARQAGQLNTHTRYLNGAILDYAEALLATFPTELSQVMFTCTGSEANDLAVRVAKTFTGGTGFIVTENAYHGVTEATAGLSPSLGADVAPAPHVFTVPAPDARRFGNRDVGGSFADAVGVALERMAAQRVRPAALVVDTIFSSDGVHAEPAGFLQAAVDRIRAAGGIVITDEVQAGFGRTGEALWGFARHGIVPDLVTMGKPMGNGHPIAALVARPDLLRRFGAGSRYFNTFGGNTVSVAVAHTVLNIIQAEGLTANALAVGRYLRSELARRAARHERLGDIRGSGLYIGVDVLAEGTARQAGAAEAARIVNALRDRRVLIGASGRDGNVLKIRPPLPFGRAEADIFLAAFDDVLAGLR